MALTLIVLCYLLHWFAYRYVFCSLNFILILIMIIVQLVCILHVYCSPNACYFNYDSCSWFAYAYTCCSLLFILIWAKSHESVYPSLSIVTHCIYVYIWLLAVYVAHCLMSLCQFCTYMLMWSLHLLFAFSLRLFFC